MELILDHKPPFILDKNFAYPKLPNQYLKLYSFKTAKTLRTYAYQLLHWLQWCEDNGKAWDKVTMEDILSYQDGMKVSNCTVNSRLQFLGRFYSWAKYFGVKSPVEGLLHPRNLLRRPFQRKPIRLLPLPDVNVFIGAFPKPRDRLIASVMLFSGLRRCEVLGLRRDCFEPKGEVANVFVTGKGGKTRTVEMPLELCARMLEFGEDVLVFGTLHEDTINKAFAANRRRTGIVIHPHLLRHTFASHRLASLEEEVGQRGAPLSSALKTLQLELGHSNIETTSEYVHLIEPARIPGSYTTCMKNIIKGLNS